jgi:hypothetical protein
MMQKVRRYIEIYSNVTDEILLRIEIKIGANQIKEFISIDSDDPDALGVYSLNDNDLKKFGITNYDGASISFFITSEL